MLYAVLFVQLVCKYTGEAVGNLFFFGSGEKREGKSFFCRLWFWCGWSGLQMCFYRCGGFYCSISKQTWKNVKPHRNNWTPQCFNIKLHRKNITQHRKNIKSQRYNITPHRANIKPQCKNIELHRNNVTLHRKNIKTSRSNITFCL